MTSFFSSFFSSGKIGNLEPRDARSCTTYLSFSCCWMKALLACLEMGAKILNRMTYQGRQSRSSSSDTTPALSAGTSLETFRMSQVLVRPGARASEALMGNPTMEDASSKILLGTDPSKLVKSGIPRQVNGTNK